MAIYQTFNTCLLLSRLLSCFNNILTFFLVLQTKSLFCSLTRLKTITNVTYKENTQGDPNQNLLFQMAEPLKQVTSDHMLVKPKRVWRGNSFIQFSKICLHF